MGYISGNPREPMSKPIDNSIDDLASIRNIGIIAHIDAGKTTTSERFLYLSGKTHRIGDIDSGNTVMDYLSEEKRRGITIISAAACFDWTCAGRTCRINLIDTPGHIDFTAEVERSLRVIDGAVVIFSGVEGVEAQSEKVWHQSVRYGVPKLAFINKLDRLGASFVRIKDDIREKFPDVGICPLQMPIGIESEFSGLVDLLEMKALYFKGDDGCEIESGEIPEDVLEAASALREEMISVLSDLSDDVAELFIDGGDIPRDMLEREIRRLTIANKLVPLLAGSAKKNIGTQPMLDAVNKYLPSPLDIGRFPALSPKSGEAVTIEVTDESFSALVFKVVAGESADLLYIRVYSGKVKLGDTLSNPRTGAKVRIKRLLGLYAKNVEPIDEAKAGDIVGLIGPQEVFTGDTLCSVNHPLLLEKITFPEPVISMAVEPKSSKDKDRLDSVLSLLCREDPTLHLRVHEATGQRLLSGMGELHLEISSHRIREEFNLDARFGVPQVAFRETIKEAGSVTGELCRTFGETELSAKVEIMLEPAPKLPSGILVLSEIKRARQLPSGWISAAEESLSNGLKTGGNWGYPLIYIKGTLLDIDADPEKTNEGIIAGATLDALHKIIRSGTVILEPIVRLDVIAPESAIGEITGYVQAKRAVINKIETLAGSKHLKCEVPLAEMFGFSKALPKLSGGRAAFSMEPCGYQEISERDIEKLASRDSRIMLQS
ncbi:MAG: elongation factor G [Victivallales bacterium]|nr:elongation factor G [Victivallales bacterium]